MKVDCSSACSFLCLAFGYLNYILCGFLERIINYQPITEKKLVVDASRLCVFYRRNASL